MSFFAWYKTPTAAAPSEEIRVETFSANVYAVPGVVPAPPSPPEPPEEEE